MYNNNLTFLHQNDCTWSNLLFQSLPKWVWSEEDHIHELAPNWDLSPKIRNHPVLHQLKTTFRLKNGVRKIYFMLKHQKMGQLGSFGISGNLFFQSPLKSDIVSPTIKNLEKNTVPFHGSTCVGGGGSFGFSGFFSKSPKSSIVHPFQIFREISCTFPYWSLCV